ncbi:MAG: tetratricopeptide repeat protein [Ignavibacteriae bacterium]|nr:tetratricopeptide repeat protein [Ignavibacteriota bacterium]
MQRYLLSVVILTIIILSGCSVGDFLGAYFNTYYNAQRQYNEAEAEVLNAPAQPGARTEKEFLAPFDASSQSKTKFTAVIEKCSKLLQYHPESKLVDDALFMIGKSYYYQNEHQSAERKFNELISTHPESDLLFEARLLLAETQYRSNNKDLSARSAQALIDDARAADEEGIVARAANLLAHIEVERKDMTDAIEHYKITAELAETSVERATAYRSLAALYDQQKEYAKAVDAFAQAEDVSTDYVAIYKAELGEAKSLSKLGKHEKSLSLLESLISNENYREFYGEVDLEIGNVYRDMGDFASAEVQYRYVDTAYARTEAAANSYFQLGLLYENELYMYDSAKVAYDKGKSEFTQATITPTLVKKSDNMTKYFGFKSDLAKYDSIRLFILYPPDTLAASKADSSEVDSTISLVQTDSLQRDSTTLLVQTDSLKHDSTELLVQTDSLKHDSTKLLVQTDSLKHDSTTAHGKTDSALVRTPVIPPPPIDTVRARLAFNKSELASLFYSGFDLVDSAKYWYERLLNDHPSSMYAPRALYTLAEILGQDSTLNRGRVDSLRREIVDKFPESEFANEARRLLGLPALEKRTDPQIAAYDSADQLLKNGEVSGALDVFRQISRADSTSDVAAKAQYAIGWIYENVHSKKDSSIVNYERLVGKFPNSQYAALVRPRLAEVEAQRQSKLQEEKLKQEQLRQQHTDSTATPNDVIKSDQGMQPTPTPPPPVKDTIAVPPPQDVKKDDEEIPTP